MAIATETRETVKDVAGKYKYGFVTDIESDLAPKGLNEDTVRFISAKKDEPEWLLEWRLKAYRRWLRMKEPTWANVHYPQIDFQDSYYYAAPKRKEDGPKSLDEVDPDILETYKKLGIPLREQEILAGVVAVDAVFDSVSVATTFKGKLKEAGVIFCSISEAARDYPDLVRKYLGTVVPYSDNFYATLNSAVYSDGTFVYVPEGVRCPMELSTYFRINEANTGQFERTLIIADKGSYVSYLEGCTAPQRDENQLHAAVVELIALDDAEIKYSTVQNWYPGDENGKGGIYNFVTKRGACRGRNSRISWTQVETGSAITWKYPSCILEGDNSQGEFYSVAITNNYQQADTGTKMIHMGKNTRSRIISKGISAGHGQNTYRGLVRIMAGAEGARNFTQCDSLLLGETCGAHTVPYVEVRNPSAQVEHEATTSRISEDQLFYCMQRGLDAESAVALIVNGFCKDVMQHLPMEFAVEAQKLLGISLEGSVG
ncbi:MAG: Fe-S cluster assembly protein SufB [Sphingomonadales bacterium]